MVNITIDFETYSEANLKKVGAWKYSEHPSTDIICMSWAIDDGPVEVHDPEYPFPKELRCALLLSATVEAHGSMFERAIWQNVAEFRYQFPPIRSEQWRCTMAACAYKAIPLKLEHGAKVLKLKNQKDMDGHRVMLRVSKPDKHGVRDEDFGRLQVTYGYCGQDVEVEREMSGVVGPLPPQELALWRLDQEMNERGIQIDLAGARSALVVANSIESRYTENLKILTSGEVPTIGCIDKLVAFCGKNGVDIPNLQKITVAGTLAGDIPPVVRKVLEIRQAIGRSSTKKYDAMLRVACDDGRARGLIQYHGATTGRFAGRLIQPHNFTRGVYKVIPDHLVAAIRLEDPELLDMIYGSAMQSLSDAVRMMLIAAAGKTLVAGDYNAIEARVLMVMAGEDEAVRLFASGQDIYLDFGAGIFGRKITKEDDPEERQISKHAVLGLGFQMGVDRFIEQVFENSGGTIILDRDLAERIVYYYRKVKYPRVVDFWYGLERAAVQAVHTGKPAGYRDVEFQVFGAWLACRLPSGRRLWYRDPEVRMQPTPWSTEEEPDIRPVLHYWAKREGVWRDIQAYGGHLTENVVQGTARDIMVHGMWNAEKCGYPLVLTVHDELVTEPEACKAGVQSPRMFEEIMEDLPSWASGYPIAAEAWSGQRYRK